MKRTSKFFLTVWLTSLFALSSCAIDQYFEFPKGEKGDPGDSGKSAYEVWVEFIENNGDPDWTGGSDLPDFFIYLKGEKGDKGDQGEGGLGDIPPDFIYIDQTTNTWVINGDDTGVPAAGPAGQNGTNGTNGINGLNAYELWVQYISDGSVDNPHEDPGVPGDEKWDPEDDDMADFWWFLTGAKGKDGADGESAWKLWQDEVAKGLDDPRTDEVDTWPETDISLEYFWLYLRGRDGKDGKPGADGQPGLPGTPGGVVEIVKDKYNVIAQYSLQSHSEYVSTDDGSVTYIVYDKSSNPLEGAIITNMPGMPGKTFTSLAEGKFKVEKGDLPQNVPASTRFGSATVKEGNLTAEPSATNTYVPEKIDIRFRLGENLPNNSSPVVLVVGDVQVSVTVERRTAVGSEWETIPSYLPNLEKDIKTYYLSKDNPVPTLTTVDENKLNISSPNAIIKSLRPRVFTKNLGDNWENMQKSMFDGTHYYATFELDSYYGETERLIAKDGTETHVNVHRAPIQRLPVITEVAMKTPTSGGNGLETNHIIGKFDTSELKYDYFYMSNITNAEAINGDLWYTTTRMDDDVADAQRLMTVYFTYESSGGQEQTTSTGTAPGERLTFTSSWAIQGLNVYDTSNVYVGCTRNHLVVGAGYEDRFTFGKLDLSTRTINPHPGVPNSYPASTITTIDIANIP